MSSFTGLLGPDGSPLRRTRSILAFVVGVLLVLVAILGVLGRPVPMVWALVLVGVFVLGHRWSWPRRDGRPVASADVTLSSRVAVATGVTVGVASGFALVLQGGSVVQGLLQTVVTTVIVLPLLVLIGRVQQRRRT